MPAGFPRVAEPALPPPPAHVPLDPALRGDAKIELLTAAHSSDRDVRQNALQAMSEVLPDDAKPLLRQAVNDPDPLVRKVAIIAAGVLRMSDLHQALLARVNDADANVRLAVRFALHRIGDVRLSHDFEKTATDATAGVRADTALLLGLLGEPSAVRILRRMQQDSNAGVRLQASEALWQLGDEGGLQPLIAATISGFADDQIIGLLGLARPGNRRVMQVVRGGLIADLMPVRLAAARAAGMLGSDEGYVIATDGAKSPDAMERGQAALALGAIGRSDAQSVLRQLLKDTSAYVRVDAATAILQLKNPSASSAAQ
jgi:HEAT repeat protein